MQNEWGKPIMGRGCSKLKCLVEVGAQRSLEKLWDFYKALDLQWGLDRFYLPLMEQETINPHLAV